MEDLLKFKIDVCSRIPLGLMCQIEVDLTDYDEFKGREVGGILKGDAELLLYDNNDGHVEIYPDEPGDKGEYMFELSSDGIIEFNNVYPYLRPFTDMTEDEIHGFIYAFFPFMFGIYPYSVVTDKQKKAMKDAGVDFKYQTIYKITFNCLIGLLSK